MAFKVLKVYEFHGNMESRGSSFVMSKDLHNATLDDEGLKEEQHTTELRTCEKSWHIDIVSSSDRECNFGAVCPLVVCLRCSMARLAARLSFHFHHSLSAKSLLS